DLLGGDVWAWQKTLAGTCRGCPPEATIALLVNGTPIPAEREGDAFTAVAKLDPGENEVLAVATMPDGREERSPPVTYTVRLEPRPTGRLTTRIDGERVVFGGTASEASEYDGAVIKTWSVSLTEMASRPAGQPATSRLSPRHPVAPSPSLPGIWSGAIPIADGEYYASLTVEDDRGRTDSAASYFVVTDGQARVPDAVQERAAWISDAVVYGVVPRNFDPPGFNGVTARLDDLADLGVTALWFSPITRTLPDLFGYEVTDYFDVRAEYGTKEDFRALVEAAHARGIRVLMDFVPNHTSIEHPYARDATANGQASTHWDYYDRDPGGNPTHYFSWTHLPNLNYDNPEVGRFMMEAFSYWVREFDVDGFRVDAVWGIKERNPEWLTAFLAEMNRIKPDSLLIAEASARDEFYFEQGFDAAYDWTDELGQWAWGDALGGIAPIGEAMVDVLTDGGQGYHEAALVMRFLNNNDTGQRFVSTYGVDFYRIALAMLLTLPGLPCLYTGDEVGAEYQPYSQSGPIDWTDHHRLREDTKKLIALRRGTPALHSREWLPLAVEPATPLFAYQRGGEGGRLQGERAATPLSASPPSPLVIVLLNFSGSDIEAVADLPDDTAATLADRELTDLWSGDPIPAPADRRVTVAIPGWGFRFLTRAPSS
ncbi:MAG: alpha amylase catalytic region, partial [Thermomicrobiales bacterium]|nr:alpha amylase catalytic region [Thermomicrobiales bacterium]